GVRIIATNGGRAGPDLNGFLGVFDLTVQAGPFVDGDGDGMPDAWETEYGVTDPNDDPDFDGLTNLQEFTNWTNPNEFDTDGDTLSDGVEVNTYHSSPLLVDTDGDLFTDRQEILFGGNPINAALFPDNLALAGTNLFGVKDSIATGADTPFVQVAGSQVNINDGNLNTLATTFNGGGLTTASYVGVVWPFMVTNPIAYIDLTMATFVDGGWFGVNTVGPGAGGLLTATHLTQPIVQVSTNGGTDWVEIPFSSNYTNKLLGHQIGGGTAPNPTSVTVTFTNATAVSNINAIRIIGAEGGQASRGFLGVWEFTARTAVSDSDGDGMSDSWELIHGLTVGVNDAAGDLDADGLSNINEFNKDTDPQVPDTDADGLTDGAEVNTYLTKPLVADTDADGLSDGAEVNTHLTNPLVKDSDSDGFNDGHEVAQGTNPTSSASFPSNLASMVSASGILGTKAAIDGTAGTLVFNQGGSSSINDGNLTTRVDSYAGDGNTYSFVGILWTNLITNPIVRMEFTLATFFDGGWFGVNGTGPGSGGVLGPAYLLEPTVQVSTNGGTNWVTVPHASDYLTNLTGHPLPAVDFGLPTSVTAHFIFINPVTNINGIRIIGKEGGPASGGFLGVFELAARNMIADADADGMNDEWEGFFGLTVGVNDSAGDGDADGLSNLLEFQNNARPNTADTDGDGLNDGAEVTTHHTSPTNTDSDGDGLSDGAEVNTHFTNPTLADSDGDGFRDGLELAQGTNPNSAASHPANYALAGSGIIGVAPTVGSALGTLVFNGVGANINDENVTTRVDNFTFAADTNAFVGIVWNTPLTNINSMELVLATFFDGGWFGVNGIGPGSGGFLSNSIHLLEPVVQVSSDGGVTWSTVAHTSDYLTALNGHPLPAVDFGLPTSVSAHFHIVVSQTNINGIRIIGSEGGPAGAGFLGVFELGVESSAAVSVTVGNVALVSGQIRFEFDSLTGVSHRVQYKNSLADALWQTHSTIAGDGTRKTVTDGTGDAMRIYRVTSE
ncbi:MAG TPA: binary toxin-like calcium binding domain-containing protein, partial [Candidatus Limnocylindria bacterium]|nr:binary toxin-like calcium binding domain-containing protein [Candidatus Limnocylindria bacterium]